MRLSTKTKTTFAVATAVSLIGAVASAQNLRVMGITTGEGAAYFNSGASVRGPITMTSPDSTNIYAISLARTNENGRSHQWSWWHMNSVYGQDSLQLWEYHTDSAGMSCSGNAAGGAMCAPRLTVAKGGNVGIGVQSAAYPLDVAGDVRATGWLRSEGNVGWYSQSYGGGWYMQDTAWVRTVNQKGVWTGAGVLESEGGLTMGWGGGTPPPSGAVIRGNVDVGPMPAGGFDQAYPLYVNGPVAAGGSEIIFTDAAHNHSERGNTAGYAAIENSANYGTLMILGRSTTSGRMVGVWDHLTVSGILKAPANPGVYWCPPVAADVTSCGTLSLRATCSYGSYYGGPPQTQPCSLVGRLISP
jgi:Bacterial shufflon protein, N-terminal constant region